MIKMMAINARAQGMAVPVTHGTCRGLGIQKGAVRCAMYSSHGIKSTGSMDRCV